MPAGNSDLNPGVSRRQLVISAGRMATLPAFGGVAASVLAACGQKDSDSSGPAAGLAKPGTEIPQVHVDWGVAPFPDETVAVVGMKEGYFDDVGIEIGPTPTGAKIDVTANSAPLLSGQVQIASGVIEAFLPQLDSVKEITSFVYLGNFNGTVIMAPPNSPAKTVDDFMSEGDSFEEALKKTMAQLKGKTVALATDPAARFFYKTVFDLGGITQDDFDRKDLSSTNIVNLALAGRIDFPAPSGGVELLTLRNRGFKTLISDGEMIEKSNDPRRYQLAIHSGYLTTKKYYNDHYETILRAASGVYRTLQLVHDDFHEAATLQLPFLNAYAGFQLSEAQLKGIHESVANLKTFDTVNTYFTQKDSPLNIYTVAQAQIDALRKDKVLKDDHSPSEVEGAKRVWDDLNRYKRESDKLFRDEDVQSNTDLVARARKQYDALNYLDSYRFLAAAKEQGS
jgi:ABC-type nitrate/sulfonate/bicarbonate transport system substrate-binding protein